MTEGGAVSEAQEPRRAFRTALFQRRGWTAERAAEWAERLTRRDAERDDRRICQECAHAQQDGGCFAAKQGRIYGAVRNLAPVRDVLARCEGFEWAKP